MTPTCVAVTRVEMTKLQVPATWMAQGYLPPICARHGGPATSVQQRKFYTRAPHWSYALILIGLVIFAIVTMAIRTTVAAGLPRCSECSRDRRRFGAYVLSGWVVTVTVMVLAIVTSSELLLLVSFVVLVLALLFCFAGDFFRVSGSVSTDRVWVNLKGVHETFAAAINNALLPPAPAIATAAPYQPTRDILPGL